MTSKVYAAAMSPMIMVDGTDTSITNIPNNYDPNHDHDPNHKDEHQSYSDQHGSYTSVMQGLTLNMNEPWERSLSRLLQADNSNSTIITEQLLPTMVSPTSTVHIGTAVVTVTGVPELMLLGRTESRDYALEIEGTSSSMNLTMDDSSSCIGSSSSISGGGDGGTCRTNTLPIRSRQYNTNSIYRTNFNISKKNLVSTSRKSLFDDDSEVEVEEQQQQQQQQEAEGGDNDDNDDEQSDDGRNQCRLKHKFSNDSLFLFYDYHQQQQQNNNNNNVEDRCEQNDDSERRNAAAAQFDNNDMAQPRSFSIHKASAIGDDNDNDDDNNNDNDYYYTDDDYNMLYESQQRQQQLYIPEYSMVHNNNREQIQQRQRSISPSDLYLPTLV